VAETDTASVASEPCANCGGKGYIEREAGLIRLRCGCQVPPVKEANARDTERNGQPDRSSAVPVARKPRKRKGRKAGKRSRKVNG